MSSRQDRIGRAKALAAVRGWRIPDADFPETGIRGTLNAMLGDKNSYRSPQALGPAYEHPERVSDHSIETYLHHLVRAEQRTRDLQHSLANFDNKDTLNVWATRCVPLSLLETITIARHLRTPEIRVFMNAAPPADLRNPNTPTPTAADEYPTS